MGTASRVLNGSPRVSKQALMAVQTAILELDYRPDSIARSMRKHQGERPAAVWSGNVGFLLANMGASMQSSMLMVDLLSSLRAESARRGYHLVQDCLVGDTELPRMLLDRKVEGIIAYGELTALQAESLAGAVPTVGIGNCFSRYRLPSVNVDNRVSVFQAVRALYECGHRRIAFVNNESEHADFAGRLNAFLDAMTELGLEPLAAVTPSGRDPRRTVKEAEKNPPDMETLIDALGEGKHLRATALLVANDWQSIGVYRALSKRGVRPGEDVAVIGFDNDIRICESLTPTLSSIQYPAEKIGRIALDSLIKALTARGATAPSEENLPLLIPGNLVERESFRCNRKCAVSP